MPPVCVMGHCITGIQNSKVCLSEQPVNHPNPNTLAVNLEAIAARTWINALVSILSCSCGKHQIVTFLPMFSSVVNVRVVFKVMKELVGFV